MTDLKINKLKGYDAFNKSCSFFRTEREYPGWTGEEKYIIVTDMEKEAFETAFPEIAKYLSPFVIIKKCHMEVIKEFYRNETKHKLRRFRYGCGHDDSEKDYPSEFIDFDTENRMVNKTLLEETVAQLTEKQRRRIALYYTEGYSFQQIAEIEKVGKKSVENSIHNGLKKLKRLHSQKGSE